MNASEANQLIQEAALLHSQYRHAEALAIYETLSAQPNAPPEILYNQAVQLRALKRHREALKVLTKFIALRPLDFLAWTNAGDSLRELNDNMGAAVMFGRALEIAPKTPRVRDNMARAHHNLSRALLGKNDMDGALLHAHAAFDSDPTDPEYATGLGEIQLSIGDYREGWPKYEARFSQQYNSIKDRVFHEALMAHCGTTTQVGFPIDDKKRQA